MRSIMNAKLYISEHLADVFKTIAMSTLINWKPKVQMRTSKNWRQIFYIAAREKKSTEKRLAKKEVAFQGMDRNLNLYGFRLVSSKVIWHTIWAQYRTHCLREKLPHIDLRNTLQKENIIRENVFNVN